MSRGALLQPDDAQRDEPQLQRRLVRDVPTRRPQPRREVFAVVEAHRWLAAARAANRQHRQLARRRRRLGLPSCEVTCGELVDGAPHRERAVGARLSSAAGGEATHCGVESGANRAGGRATDHWVARQRASERGQTAAAAPSERGAGGATRSDDEP
eukprot:738239-Prymnesium_polylepis.1